MDSWQKDLLDIVETVAGEVDRFFLGMSEMIDTFVEFTEEIGEQMQNSIATDLEMYLQELIDPIPERYWELEDSMLDIDPAFPYYLEATSEKNPACMGCQHYHGHVYGGNLLVCGMHPSGYEGDSCPDWQAGSFEC
ncbi:MAG: hypothetical protein KME64_31150 [Scytonematopsis contorta HA4267-MV1]|jgi:hypothetical protein|nr:hypothetical protein [Scytonematopsis contorta HA4267-MV1]